MYSRKFMIQRSIPDDDRVIELLGSRLGDAAVTKRLALERAGGKPAAGRGTPFAWFEEWLIGPAMLRNTLRVLGLLERGRRNALDIRLTFHDFICPRLPAALSGLRVLHLSDLHIDVSTTFESVLIASIAQAGDYDVCVITGDLRFRTHGDSAPALAAMKRLRDSFQGRVFLVLGNHDSLRWVPVLEDYGYETLINEALALQLKGEKFWIAGIDDAGFFGADDLAAAASDIPKEAFRLLLSHSPEIVRDQRISEFDLVLCGHSHGGQINLPGGWPLVTNARCARRYCRGRWRLGGTHGYTSLGAGTSLLDVRFNCPPEICVHRLLCPQAPSD